MGRKAVRAAIQAAIQGAGITFVGTVYPARPQILQEQDYVETMSGEATAASANGSACVVVVNITKDRRERRADSGRTAVTDSDVHDIVLELFFASISGTGIAAQDDYDTIVDGLTDFVRGHATMNASTTVWSAGEFTAGVEHEQSEPYSPDDEEGSVVILITGSLRFEAWEWVQGPATSI